MAMAGIPWWTMDIGGFHGGDIRDPSFHELMIRWFQWAVFTPILRMHGYRDPFTEPEEEYRDGIAQFNTGAGNELWSFGEGVYGVLQRFLRIRERLKPYVRDLMVEAHEEGTPLMRPMFYAYPEQPTCWGIHDQYLFGADLLVAPVLEEGQTTRKVYLPEGSAWVHAFSGQRHPGGGWIQCELEIEALPVFVRESAPDFATLRSLFDE
jgi:alpha-D-xyloside xylohydrolase